MAARPSVAKGGTQTPNLLIVESPNKCKKLGALLGPGWRVEACFGHIRDLPLREMGVQPPDYRPQYELRLEKSRLQRLKDAVRQAGTVYLASDPDREGESIAWHLAQVLGLKNPRRVCFHAITRDEVLKAVAAPRQIDMKLVAAQEARRVLDRLIGYKVSPWLSRLLDQNLSAGRVQTPALGLVVKREQEILNHRQALYYEVTLDFAGGEGGWQASWQPKPLLPPGEKLCQNKNLAEQAAAVRQVRITRVERLTQEQRPPAPFTTSTLQQAASSKLDMSPERTMKAAQGLFEAGAITYHRTDSRHLSEEAVTAIRDWLVKAGFAVPPTPNVFQSGPGAQEAHEAIRPSHIEAEQAGENEDERRLYELIRQRTLASQMLSAQYDVLEVELASTQDARFQYLARKKRLVSPGWLALWNDERDEQDEGQDSGRDSQSIPDGLRPDDVLDVVAGHVQEKRTQPPRRYTEAGLVKALEAHGIGRPSTYASIIRIPGERGYWEVRKKTLHPSPLGVKVSELLQQHFSFAAVEYTRHMESLLDEIAQGNRRYVDVVTELDKKLTEEFERAQASAVVAADEAALSCPSCGKPMRRRSGRNGPFWGCSGYPDCRQTLPIQHKKAA